MRDIYDYEIAERPVVFEPIAELEHYILCPECGQAVDVRASSEVFHHGEEGHRPLPTH